MGHQPQESVPPKRRGNKASTRERARSPYNEKHVKVLLLTFMFNDLNLAKETNDVRKAFDSLGYEVVPYEIEMENSKEKLCSKLEEFLNDENGSGLRIIYYHGHGGHDEHKKFKIISHNHEDGIVQMWKKMVRFYAKSKSNIRSERISAILSECSKTYNRVISIPWEPIRDEIMRAPGDTLIILDCCEAGLAAAEAIHTEEALENAGDENNTEDSASNQEVLQLEQKVEEEMQKTVGQNANSKVAPDHNLLPRKELIGACGWGNETMNHMSPAMCKTLSALQSRSSISTFTLVNSMNSRLVSNYKGNRYVPQAVHYVLRDTRRPNDKDMLAGKIILYRYRD